MQQPKLNPMNLLKSITQRILIRIGCLFFTLVLITFNLHPQARAAGTCIVFACKSNTSRSQMAEGWAKEWIKLAIDQAKAQPFSPQQQENIDKLQSIRILSGALSQSKVSKKNAQIKAAAIEAMAEWNIDLSLQKVNAIEDLEQSLGWEFGGSSLTHKDQVKLRSISGRDLVTEDRDLALDHLMDSNAAKPLLIVLCDCQVDQKLHLTYEIHRWNDIEAPSHAPDPDLAFQRVCLTIKKRVYALMAELIPVTKSPALSHPPGSP